MERIVLLCSMLVSVRGVGVCLWYVWFLCLVFSSSRRACDDDLFSLLLPLPPLSLPAPLLLSVGGKCFFSGVEKSRSRW